MNNGRNMRWSPWLILPWCGMVQSGGKLQSELLAETTLRETRMQRTHVWTLRGEEGVGWIGRQELIYMLIYTKYITNENLQYNTGNAKKCCVLT